MMTFVEFVEFVESEKRIALYGIGKDRRKDTSRCAPRQLGNLFKAVNPADLGMQVVWNFNATPMGRKARKSGVVGGK